MGEDIHATDTCNKTRIISNTTIIDILSQPSAPEISTLVIVDAHEAGKTTGERFYIGMRWPSLYHLLQNDLKKLKIELHELSDYCGIFTYARKDHQTIENMIRRYVHEHPPQKNA